MSDHGDDCITTQRTRAEEAVLDVVREEVSVSKEVVETGRVDLIKTVTIEEVPVTVQRMDSGYDVERRAVGELFDEAPASTTELPDGTIVYRVIREVPTVVTRYEVVEEVHVRPTHIAHDDHHVVPVRVEHVEVRRTPLATAPIK